MKGEGRGRREKTEREEVLREEVRNWREMKGGGRREEKEGKKKESGEAAGGDVFIIVGTHLLLQ